MESVQGDGGAIQSIAFEKSKIRYCSHCSIQLCIPGPRMPPGELTTTKKIVKLFSGKPPPGQTIGRCHCPTNVQLAAPRVTLSVYSYFAWSMLVKEMSGLSLNAISCHLLIVPGLFPSVSACSYACTSVLTLGRGLRMFFVFVQVTHFPA